MSILKSVVVAVLLMFAIFFLAMGMDVPVPHLPWRGMAARDIPMGILLVLASIVVARFWTVPEDEQKLIDDFHRSRNRRK